MSWDLFLQDLPKGITRVQDIPENFAPGPVGARAEIEALFQRVFPGLRLHAPGFWSFDCEDGSIEFFVDNSDPINSIMLACRGGRSLCRYIDALVREWDRPILDAQSPTGLLSSGQSCDHSLAVWRNYRDTSLAEEPSTQRTPAGVRAWLRRLLS